MSSIEPFDLNAVREAIRDRLPSNENIEDVLQLGVHLANRRAELLGRSPEQADLEFVLAALCWWPGKTKPEPPVTMELVRIRSQLLADRRRGFRLGRRRLGDTVADSVVPDSALRMSFSELEAAQQQGTDYLDTTVLGDDVSPA